MYLQEKAKRIKYKRLYLKNSFILERQRMIHAIKRAKGYIYGSKHHLDYALETFELFLEKKKISFLSR